MKQRRLFLRRMGGLAAILAITSSGKNVQGAFTDPAPRPTGELPGKFVHVVFFWLIDDAGETRAKFMTELRKFIDHVDVIKTKHIGSPANTDRDVIDNTYSYSLILSFDSKQEHDLYQEHPLHKEFIANASSLWKKVLVYDSLKA